MTSVDILSANNPRREEALSVPLFVPVSHSCSDSNVALVQRLNWNDFAFLSVGLPARPFSAPRCPSFFSTVLETNKIQTNLITLGTHITVSRRLPSWLIAALELPPAAVSISATVSSSLVDRQNSSVSSRPPPFMATTAGRFHSQNECRKQRWRIVQRKCYQITHSVLNRQQSDTNWQKSNAIPYHFFFHFFLLV